MPSLGSFRMPESKYPSIEKTRRDCAVVAVVEPSRGAQPVYSHETALSLHDLTDLMPAKIHMTVPKSFRRNSKTPKQLVLHYADVPDKDTEMLHGVRVTRPLRAILDLLYAGDPKWMRRSSAVRPGSCTNPSVSRKSRAVVLPAKW